MRTARASRFGTGDVPHPPVVWIHPGRVCAHIGVLGCRPVSYRGSVTGAVTIPRNGASTDRQETSRGREHAFPPQHMSVPTAERPKRALRCTPMGGRYPHQQQQRVPVALKLRPRLQRVARGKNRPELTRPATGWLWRLSGAVSASVAGVRTACGGRYLGPRPEGTTRARRGRMPHWLPPPASGSIGSHHGRGKPVYPERVSTGSKWRTTPPFSPRCRAAHAADLV